MPNGLLLFCSFLRLDLQDFVLSPLIFHLYMVSLGNHIHSHEFSYHLTLLTPKSISSLAPSVCLSLSLAQTTLLGSQFVHLSIQQLLLDS